ncbi:hypothetical protein [Lentilactobacillus fungorum]|uniref:hypothetical protein n=1 Tax=Lentilactobacillus fungorum TaxID=2201250 RepID=UPI0027E4ED13|nr:hypothetical protein [Lentilactobacillus fungorum]
MVTNLKENNQKNYLGILDNHLIPKFRIHKIKSINPTMIQAYLNELGDSSLFKHTYEIIQTVLRKASKIAVFPYQLIKQNPTIYTQFPQYIEDRTYTREN